MYHVSIRCAPEDEKPSSLEWSELSERYLELMDLQDNPFVATTHGDNHIHLLVSRVDDDGNCYDSSWDYRKSEKALRTIEIEGGYKQVHSSSEVGKRRDTNGQVHRIRKEQKEYDNGLREEPPESSKRTQLQKAIEQGIEQSSSVEGIEEFLSRQNIQTKQTQQGWSFKIDNVPFAGYQLGNHFTLNAINEQMTSQQPSQKPQQRSMGDIMRQAGQEVNTLGQQTPIGNGEFDGTDLLGLSGVVVGNALVVGGYVSDAIANLKEQFDAKGEKFDSSAANARVKKAINDLEEAGEKVDSLQDRIINNYPDADRSGGNERARRVKSSRYFNQGENANPLADGAELIDEKIQILSEEIPGGQELDSQPLKIDRSVPFDQQLEKVEQAVGQIERRSQELEDLVNEAELAESKQRQEKVEQVNAATAATATASYIESRASVYNLPKDEEIDTRTMGKMKMSPEGDYIAITKEGQDTDFEAVRVDDQWLVTKDELTQEEKERLASLPQTDQEYAVQANGRDLAAYFQRNCAKELSKDKGVITWSDKSNEEVDYSFEVERDGDRTTIRGFKAGEANSVFEVDLDEDGTAKTSQCEIPTKHIDGLLREERLREQRRLAKEKKEEEKRTGLSLSFD